MYGALFLVSGAALLAVTYFLVTAHEPRVYLATTNSHGLRLTVSDPVQQAMYARAREQRAATDHQLLTQSAVALGLMSTMSVALGWVMAGRALRPVRTMADKAHRISARNLHERLAIAGPDDELKDLGDTIDDLLERLSDAFDTQKRFVANASHELRTPLTVQRAMIEVVLADSTADTRSLRHVCERVLANGEHQEHLIEALLTLARSQRSLERRDPLDLAQCVANVVPDHEPESRRSPPRTTPMCPPSPDRRAAWTSPRSSRRQDDTPG